MRASPGEGWTRTLLWFTRQPLPACQGLTLVQGPLCPLVTLLGRVAQLWRSRLQERKRVALVLALMLGLGP